MTAFTVTQAWAVLGCLYFKEPATALKLVSIGLTVIGVMGLHAASGVPA